MGYYVIFDLLKKNSITRTLEIGFSYGYSAAYIISATRSKHIIIDPYQENYHNLGIKNLETIGFKDLYELRKDLSHVALPDLLKENKTFQFVFIDGGHKYDEIFLDWYYSDLMLEKNGYILFHDLWMRSTQMVTEFIRKNRSDYREIKISQWNLALFKKIGEDKRPWFHFKEFYNFRSLIKFNLIAFTKRKERHLHDTSDISEHSPVKNSDFIVELSQFKLNN